VNERSIRGMRSYWDEAAQKNAAWYVDTSLNFDNPDMDKFLETGRVVVAEAMDDAPVAPSGHARAIEIGCGIGRICLALSQRFDNVTGFDISSTMLDKARELVTAPNVEFVLTDGASLPGLAAGSVDLAITFTVFQHIPDVAVIKRYIDDVGAALRPGGVFVLQWNNSPGATRWRLRRSLLGALHRTGLFREGHGRTAPQFLGSIVPREQMREMLDAAGMELVATRGDNTLFCWGWARRR
jgi:SAM-dependent methyltransferase